MTAVFASAPPEGADWQRATPRPWGSEGYRFGTIAAARKGAVCIHAAADEDRPELINTLGRVNARAAGALAADAALKGPPPVPLPPLPPSGRT